VRVEAANISASSGKVVEGPRFRTEKRVYDDKGNLTWETLYNADLVLSSHYYSYQSDGTQTETAHIRRSSTGDSSVAPRGVVTSRVTWTHKSDVAGNRVESSGRAADGSVVSRLIYSYDATGNLTSLTQYASNSAPIQRWVYNGEGDIKERNGFGEKGSLTERDSYSYEYDAARNWIRRVTSRLANGAKSVADPVVVTYRTINYYPPAGDFQMNGGVVPGLLSKGGSEQSVLSGQATRRVEPVYPMAARAARVSGSVVVELTVDDEGDVLSARAISGHPLLREAALAAAWDWKFSPTVYRGKAVKIIGAIEFNFHL